MSLVHLAHACSHLQNASRARLGYTSVPRTNQLHSLLLQMQKFGYIGNVTIGDSSKGPPLPNAVSPIFSLSNASSASAEDLSSHVVLPQEEAEEDELVPPESATIPIARQRIYLALKYHRTRPVLERMNLVSKPTRRIWLGVADLAGLARGENRGYVRGLRAIGEGMFVSTDRGILELREAVERRVGGMVLCRVNEAKMVRI